MRRLLAGLLLAALVATPADAQRIRSGDLAVGASFQGYDFADGLGVQAANLLLLPLAYRFSVGSRLGFDLYSGYARGAVLIDGTEFTLSGPVDTQLRANFAAAPWAVLTFGVNAPTGVSSHTTHEARVAAVLSTDLLGFREANFGLGFGATTGVAAAYRIGRTGVGFGASYRMSSEFEPSADTAFKYTPGDEIRIRLGVDRDIAGNRMTAGVTYQNFARDELDGRDLFQPGNRWRGDVTYSFRTGAGASWTAYLTDVWRDHGDVDLDAREDGSGEGSLRIGTQNLFVAGLTGAWRVRPTLSVMPTTELRLLNREDTGGDGWIAGAGAAVPLRVRGLSVTTMGRLNYGALDDAEAVAHRFWGGELGLTIGWAPR